MQRGSTNTSFVLVLAAGVLLWAMADSDGFGRRLADAQRRISPSIGEFGTDVVRLLGSEKRRFAALWKDIRSGSAGFAERLSETGVESLGDRLGSAWPGAPNGDADAAGAAGPSVPPDVSAAPPSADDFERVDALLKQAETEVQRAHFESALATIATVRDLLGPTADSTAARRRRARVEVLVATAEVAFGEVDAARESFARAIEADPELRLDATRTSPKVLHVFNTAVGVTRRR